MNRQARLMSLVTSQVRLKSWPWNQVCDLQKSAQSKSKRAQPQSFGSTQPATQLQELANLVDRLQSTHKNADGKWIISLCDSAHGFEKLILQKTAENQWSVLVTVRADVQANLAQQDLQRLRLELQRRGHNARVESTTDKEEQA